MKREANSTAPRAHTTTRNARTVAAVSVVICGLALLVGAALTSSTPAGATGTISITQTPLGSDGPCVPSAIARLGWTYTTKSDASLFRLTVTNPSTLCDPVDAVAAIYAMPGNGVAWPQQLVTTKAFSIGEASTTEITFSKDCDPVQFDVLTGDTPKTIDVPPNGPFHGPLLFPTDTGTAEQFFPGSAQCGPPDTEPTSQATTPTSPPTQPTTSPTQPEVAAATTIQGGGTTSTPGAQPAAVQAATQTKSGAAGTSLALTGAPSASMAALGSLLLLAGLVLLVLSRRGRRAWS